MQVQQNLRAGPPNLAPVLLKAPQILPAALGPVAAESPFPETCPHKAREERGRCSQWGPGSSSACAPCSLCLLQNTPFLLGPGLGRARHADVTGPLQHRTSSWSTPSLYWLRRQQPPTSENCYCDDQQENEQEHTG